MKFFVKENSIVREIWGSADTVLFIFAGSSAEFALNKAVDWLYFTGRLPADPIGRLFSTVSYARKIIFSEYDNAIRAINQIVSIHHGVEQGRGAQIPDWAYRDVLFMLIGYSISSFEVLHRKLSVIEKEEIFDVFYRMGKQMDLKGLPISYLEYETMRVEHLEHNLIKSNFTIDLYRQYRKHLGPVRYWLLKQVQVLVSPGKVSGMLSLGRSNIIPLFLALYKISRGLKWDKLLKDRLLPQAYKAQIYALDK